MPDTIGHYRIVRQVGEGGMGRVLEARDERHDRPVAVELLRGDGAAGAQERFVREARAAASISRPNVCQIFEIGHHERAPFLAMELREGQSLAGRIASGPMPLADAVAGTLGEPAGALDLLQRAVDGGLNCPRAYELNPPLDPLRGEPARAAHDEALTAFHASGGRRLLGLA